MNRKMDSGRLDLRSVQIIEEMVGGEERRGEGKRRESRETDSLDLWRRFPPRALPA